MGLSAAARPLDLALAGLALLWACTAPSLVFAADRISLRLEGDILPECTVGSASSQAFALDVGEIAGSGARDYVFGLSCNAPFSYRLEARYGALTNSAASAAPRGFAATIPYEVRMRIPTDGAPIEDSCPGESLQAGRVRCAFSNSGNAIAIDAQGRLTLAWQAGSARLVAGNYTDHLTVTVGMRQ